MKISRSEFSSNPTEDSKEKKTSNDAPRKRFPIETITKLIR